MTPDTLLYMIAGFTVILMGIIIYILTLLFRTRSINAEAQKLEKLLEDSTDLQERITP